jgi:hypothetical protein
MNPSAACQSTCRHNTTAATAGSGAQKPKPTAAATAGSGGVQSAIQQLAQCDIETLKRTHFFAMMSLRARAL